MKFGTIIADPPWAYDRAGPKHTNASGYVDQVAGKSQYKTATTTDMAEIDVNSIAADNSVLLLWTTPAMSAGGHDRDLCLAWGFKPVTYTYWVKTTISGKMHYGVGYWFRGAVEPVLVGKRSKAYRTNERGVFDVVGGLLAPATGHSRKPDTLHRLAEQNFPGPRLEIFARRQYPGWICVGDELTNRDIADDINRLREAP